MADQPEQTDDTTVSKAGYELTFYPGFASRCAVRTADGAEVEMYRQEGTYRLPDGQTKPRDRYKIHLRGGARKQDVRFDVHDPEHRVKRITVELYGEDHVVGSGVETESAEMLTLDNDSMTCPPQCE